MPTKQFTDLWSSLFQGIPPIPHTFKHAFPDRWLRVHSLPDAKRYADSDEEWAFLLARQNHVITAVLGENEPFFMLTGDFLQNGKTVGDLWPEVPALNTYNFTTLEPYDLFALEPDFYDEGWAYQPKVTTVTWHPGEFDDILRAIAEDFTRVFFLSPARKTLVTPYDGGLDLIFPDMMTRNGFRKEFDFERL